MTTAPRIFAQLIALSLLILFPSPSSAEIPFQIPEREALLRLRTAMIKTDRGSMYLELYPEDAPWHVANFKYRADRGYYRNRSFHVFFPGYIIQGGASTSTDPRNKYTLPPEFSAQRHLIGALGMARKSDDINPERRSDGEQFHLLLADAPHMDGKYTVFGRVIKGFEVLPKLDRGTIIKSVEVFVR